MAPRTCDYLRLQIVVEMKHISWRPYQIWKRRPLTIDKFALAIIQETLDENLERTTKEFAEVLEDCGRTMSLRLVGCTATQDTANIFV
uniref:Uncharacterized protein n=1 Tax=Romanomermis culicivorax TaxID=13658 RepID=A0A915JCZ0_ROMCU